MRYDLCDLICPLSKMKAMRLIEDFSGEGTLEIALGDTDSLKNVIQELKSKGIKAAFEQEENKFVLKIARQSC